MGRGGLCCLVALLCLAVPTARPVTAAGNRSTSARFRSRGRTLRRLPPGGVCARAGLVSTLSQSPPPADHLAPRARRGCRRRGSVGRPPGSRHVHRGEPQGQVAASHASRGLSRTDRRPRPHAQIVQRRCRGSGSTAHASTRSARAWAGRRACCCWPASDAARRRHSLRPGDRHGQAVPGLPSAAVQPRFVQQWARRWGGASMKARAEIGGTPHNPNAPTPAVARWRTRGGSRIRRAVQLWSSRVGPTFVDPHGTVGFIRARASPPSSPRFRFFPHPVVARSPRSAAVHAVLDARSCARRSSISSRRRARPASVPRHSVDWYLGMARVHDARGRLLTWRREPRCHAWPRPFTQARLKLGRAQHPQLEPSLHRLRRRVTARHLLATRSTFLGRSVHRLRPHLVHLFQRHRGALRGRRGDTLSYRLGHGTTPSSWASPRVPFTTTAPDDPRLRALASPSFPERFLQQASSPTRSACSDAGACSSSNKYSDRRYLRAGVPGSRRRLHRRVRRR